MFKISKMISFSFIFLLILISPIYTLDVYVAPENTQSCTAKFFTFSPCDGSLLNPFDDLYFAMKTGVTKAQAKLDMTLHFYIYGSAGVSVPGSWISIDIYTNPLINGDGNPFKSYQGQIILEGYPSGSYASIYLKTDAFTFYIQNTLILKNIIFLGFDMHVKNANCPQMLSGFCCAPNSDMLLFYDSTSVCFILKEYINYQGSIYNGFIQLAGNLGSQLQMQNVAVNYFNSFEKQINFIWSSSPLVSIIINNVQMREVYLAGAFLKSEANSKVSLSISNFQMTLYNMFLFNNQDSRSKRAYFIYLSNASGALILNSVSINQGFVADTISLINTALQVVLTNMMLTYNDLSGLDTSFLPSVISSANSFNNITIALIQSNFVLRRVLLTTDSNTNLSLVYGQFNDIKCVFLGTNNHIILSSIYSSDSHSEVFTFLETAQNNIAEFRDSVMISLGYPLIYYYAPNNSVFFYNITIGNLRSSFAINFNLDETPNLTSILDMNYLTIILLLDILSFVISWSSMMTTIRNSNLNMLYLVTGGIFLILGDGNIQSLYNCTVNTVDSYTLGAIYAAFGGQNNYLTILNSSFFNITTGIQSNIVATNTNIVFNNTKFSELTSPLGTFIVSSSSNVFIYNCSIDIAQTLLTGFMLIFSSNVTILQCNFTNIIGDSAAFAQISNSNISLIQSLFDKFTYGDSFIVLEMNSGLNIINCNYSNYIGDNFLFAVTNNIIKINNTIFDNGSFSQGGLFYGKIYNEFYLETIQINQVSSGSYGTIFYTFDQSLIVLSNINVTDVTAATDAIFFILRTNLSISNSNFSNCFSKGLGGIIQSSFSIIDVNYCNFYQSSAKTGGVLYLESSNVTIFKSSFQGSSGNIFASAIYAEDSSLYMNHSYFTNNQMNDSLQFDYSTIYVENNQDNQILIENTIFENDAINSQHIILVNGGLSINLSNVNFINNSYGYSILSLTEIDVQMKSVSFVGNSLDNYMNIKESSNEMINLDDLKFINNSFTSYIIAINLQNIGFLNNFTFESNKLIGTQGTFLDLSNAKLLKISDFNVFNNLDATNIFNDVYFLKISDCVNVLINDFSHKSNFAQAIYASNSTIKVNSLQSYENNNYLFISAYSSNLSINSSHFENHNKFTNLLNNLNYQNLIILSNNSNITLIKSEFLNNQNLSKSFAIPQYELFVTNGFSLEINECSFINDYSSSLKADSINNVKIMNSKFNLQNSFLASNSTNFGGIEIDNASYILIDNSNFTNLGSELSDSGLHLENYNNLLNITITNTNFTSNTAYQGGALSLIGLTNTIIENCKLLANKAIYSQFRNIQSGLGGAIFSECIIDNGCLFSLKDTLFQDNNADVLGGSMFLEKYEVSSRNAVGFINNTDSMGSDSSVLASPFFINLTQITNANNETSYFFNDTFILEINNAQTISLYFSIFDSSNTKSLYESNSSIILFDMNNALKLMKGNTAFTNQGDFAFSNLYLLGAPNITYNFSINMNGRFQLSKYFAIKIRLCTIGEYYDVVLETCLICPYGTYSFINPVEILPDGNFIQKNIIICQPCPDNAFCQGSMIVPDSNYWISDNANSTQIVKCPIESCLSQDFTSFQHHIPCITGYTGPLCVKCDSGFSKDTFISKCLKCQESSEYYGLFFGKLIFMLLFVSYQVFTKLFGEDSKKATTTGVIIKILRDHFNQIFMIFTISNFLKISSGVENAHNNVNNVVTGLTLNINCFVDDNQIQIVYFMIFWIMISPIYMIAFIGIAFLLLFIFKCIRKKNVHFNYYLKTLLTAFIVVCDTQYAQILVGFFKLFECVSLDSDKNDSYLNFSPNILCYSNDHNYFIKAIGVPSLIIWILGLPLTFFIVLTYLHKRNLLESKYSTIGLNATSPQKLEIDTTTKLLTNNQNITSLQAVPENKLIGSHSKGIITQESIPDAKNHEIKNPDTFISMSDLKKNDKNDEIKESERKNLLVNEKTVDTKNNDIKNQGTFNSMSDLKKNDKNDEIKETERKKLVENEKTVTKGNEKSQKSGKKQKVYKPGAFEIDLAATVMISFLYVDYKHNNYYWSCIIMVWKFILAVLVTFVAFNYVYLSLYIFYFVMIIIYTIGEPYKFPDCSFLVILSFFCNLITVVLFEYAQNVSEYNYTIIITYFVVQFFFFFVGFLLIVKNIDYRPMAIKAVKVLRKKESNRTATKISTYLQNKYGVTEADLNEKKEDPTPDIENNEIDNEQKPSLVPKESEKKMISQKLESEEALIGNDIENKEKNLKEIQEIIEEEKENPSIFYEDAEVPMER